MRHRAGEGLAGEEAVVFRKIGDWEK